VPYVEEPHSFGFSTFYTLIHGHTLAAPLVYGRGYSAARTKAIVAHFDPLTPPALRLLRPDPDQSARIAADLSRFDRDLGHAVRRYAYGIFLPHEAIMIEPLTRGCPWWEVSTIRALYPVLAYVFRRGLDVMPTTMTAALERIWTILDEVKARLAGGAGFLVGDRLSLSDLAFATALAPLVMPDHYGAAAPTYAQLPAEMRTVVNDVRAHPSGRFVQRIYRDWRLG